MAPCTGPAGGPWERYLWNSSRTRLRQWSSGLVGWLCPEDEVQGAESRRQSPRGKPVAPTQAGQQRDGNGMHGGVMGTDPCPPSCGICRACAHSPGSGRAQRGSSPVSCGKNVRITFFSEKRGLQQQRGDPPGGRAGFWGLGPALQGPCWQRLPVGTPCRGEA